MKKIAALIGGLICASLMEQPKKYRPPQYVPKTFITNNYFNISKPSSGCGGSCGGNCKCGHKD